MKPLKRLLDDLGVNAAVSADGDRIVDCESQSPGDLRGGPKGMLPGAVIFSVDGLPATVVGLTHGPTDPDPFHARSNLRFNQGLADHVRLTIHGVAGRRARTLVDERRAAGSHGVQWDGRGDAGRPMSAGIDFVRVARREESDIQKIA